MADMDAYAVPGPASGEDSTGLRAYEQKRSKRFKFLLSFGEVKLLSIAGIGFLLDAYDLLIINNITQSLQFEFYGGEPLPAGLQDFIKAAANIGCIIGQFLFGYLADAYGRKWPFFSTLCVIIVGTILTISVPSYLSPTSVLVWIGVFRILLGIGIGGDYPMSASVVSDRANLERRGTLLAFIFANQGWGSLLASLVTIIVLSAYKHVMNDEGKVHKVDGVWRIVVGVAMVPAFATLYQRFSLPESAKFKQARALRDGKKPNLGPQSGEEEEIVADLEKLTDIPSGTLSRQFSSQQSGPEESKSGSPGSDMDGSAKEDVMLGGTGDVHSARRNSLETPGKGVKGAADAQKAHWRAFVTYFKEWRHLKVLIGCCASWFLLDIAFYGINLNQTVVLQQIGFDGTTGTAWERLFRTAIGNLIITALGFVPGYYATVLTIEYLGRRWIQVQGFLITALLLGVLAGDFHMPKVSFIACFALLQFFFNFGPNTTTYVIPAEVFPTRVRASAHAISAASGKAGAVLSALVFNIATEKIGTPNVLWIFFGCCLVGAAVTFLIPETRARDADDVDMAELEDERNRLQLN